MRWILALSLLIIACSEADEATRNAAAADAEAASLLQSVVPILEEQSCPIPSPSPSDQPQAVLAIAYPTLAEAAKICRDACQDGEKTIRRFLLGRWAWLGFISCPLTAAIERLCLGLCAEAEQKFEKFGQNIPLSLFENELKLMADRVCREAEAMSPIQEELKFVAGSVRAILNAAREKIRELIE